MNKLIQELKKIKYHPDKELEIKVKQVLESLNIGYVYQPNGTQKYPDFFLTESRINLECKSSLQDKPMWNCTYPKQDGLYVISCKKLDSCVVDYGRDIITESVSRIYEEYSIRHKELEKEIKSKLQSLVDNKFGMKVFARNMFIQTVGFRTQAEYKAKKELGQYFTESKDIQSKLLDDYTKKPKNILEPACGTGHLLPLISGLGDIIAIDIDPEVIEIAKIRNLDVTYATANFLDHKFTEKFDLIVGNPPYFELKKKDIPCGYSEVCKGRVNIYYLFVYKCINLLSNNGELRFIIPSSFLTNKYAENCRKYLIDKCKILDVVSFDSNHFKDAIQDVIIIKCRKDDNPDNSNFAFKDFIVKNCRDIELSGVTLKTLGCDVKTGNVVWNVNKVFLSNEFGLPIFYASSVSNKHQSNPDKKKYLIVSKETESKIINGPCILVQRIFSESLVWKYVQHTPDGFFVENHVNVITGEEECLKKICKSFDDPRTNFFVKKVFSNNHISKNDLQSVVQIYS